MGIEGTLPSGQWDNKNDTHHLGFRDYVKWFMKSERARLKKRYGKNGHTLCIFGVDRKQWTTFLQYWEE
jgi:hypothetical protein